MEDRATLAQHFRFLHLPPELRNRIYGECTALHQGLTPPPAITQLTRQIRRESLQIFYAEVPCFHVNVETAKGMTKFLNWLRHLTDAQVTSIQNIEFTSFSHHFPGRSKITLRQDLVSPSEVLVRFQEEMTAKLVASGNVPRLRSTASAPDATLRSAWCYCLGFDSISHQMHYCKTLRDIPMVSQPSQPFLDALHSGATWTTYHIEVSDLAKPSCLCTEPLASFWRLLPLDGEPLSKPALRKIGQALFTWNCKVLGQGERRQREEHERGWQDRDGAEDSTGDVGM